jgi:signal transduction histidine kinase
MHERARLAGGTLSIGRAETGGTLVTLVLDATAEANP